MERIEKIRERIRNRDFFGKIKIIENLRERGFLPQVRNKKAAAEELQRKKKAEDKADSAAIY